MSRRCLFWAITAGLIVDSLIFAWYFDNGPLLIFGFFAALVWIWGANVGQHLFRRDEPEYLYDRSPERIGFTDNEIARARVRDASGRTTRR
jgi:hypothetical protein